MPTSINVDLHAEFSATSALLSCSLYILYTSRLITHELTLLEVRECAAVLSQILLFGRVCTLGMWMQQLLRAGYMSRSLAHCWCVYIRCVASRELLKHHQKCQSPSCSICVPVKQHVQQQRLAAQRKMQTQHQQEMLARQRHQLQHERMHTQSQLTAESSMQVGLHTAWCFCVLVASCASLAQVQVCLHTAWCFSATGAGALSLAPCVQGRKPAFACSCGNEPGSREFQPPTMLPGGCHQGRMQIAFSMTCHTCVWSLWTDSM